MHVDGCSLSRVLWPGLCLMAHKLSAAPGLDEYTFMHNLSTVQMVLHLP